MLSAIDPPYEAERQISRQITVTNDCADQDSVDQDTDPHDEALLPESDQRQHAERPKTPARTMPALVIPAPVCATARTMPSRVSWVVVTRHR